MQATLSAGGQTIKADVWMGTTGGGPIIFYWHATSSMATYEVPVAFDTAAVAAAGGIIIGPETTTRTGTPTGNTGDDVWSQSDAAFMDQAVACAISQLHSDVRHIHAAGYSAGALQTVYVWYARSGYVASVISFSGGASGSTPQRCRIPPNVAAALVAHGGAGQDTYGAGAATTDFSQTSAAGNGHLGRPRPLHRLQRRRRPPRRSSRRAPNLKPVSFKFFQDHPFGITPEPYGTLPSGFPSYCKLDGPG